jgi:hypothetical protein
MDAKFFRVYRSPTPLIRSNLAIQRENNSFLKLQNNTSKSYKKLRKLQISDTHLAFIHKIKDSLLKKHLPKLATQVKPTENSIQLLSPRNSDDILDKAVPVKDIKSIIDNLVSMRTVIFNNNKNCKNFARNNLRTSSKKINKSAEVKPVKCFHRNSCRRRVKDITSQGIQVENQEISAWEGDFELDN